MLYFIFGLLRDLDRPILNFGTKFVSHYRIRYLSFSLSIIYTVVFRLCIRSFIHSYGTTRHGVICREKEKRKPERRKKEGRQQLHTHTHY
jgi:hypothetical protein